VPRFGEELAGGDSGGEGGDHRDREDGDQAAYDVFCGSQFVEALGTR
jgi:hypothetical protein